MKILPLFFALALVSVFGLQSCSPEEVNPKGVGYDLQTSWEENATHVRPGETCSPTVALDLALPNGSAAVDYCGSFNGSPLPCPTTVPNWGTARTSNMRTTANEDVVMVEMNMAPTWFVTNCVAKAGASQSFSFDQNGLPIVDASWSNDAISPAVNRYDLKWNLGPHYGPQCIAFAAKMTVVKINFFSPAHDPFSVRNLWVYNANFNNSATPDLNSASPLLTPWCLYPCPGDQLQDDPTARLEGTGKVDAGTKYDPARG